MYPLYQDLYERIFANRLKLWGVDPAAGEAVVARSGSLVIYGGPDSLMTAMSPRAQASRRLSTGDEQWVAWLERWWQERSVVLEECLDRFWQEMTGETVTVSSLEAVIDAKITFNAIGADSVMPAPAEVCAWLAPHVAPELVPDLVTAIFTPASGYVAYDAREVECFRVALAIRGDGSLAPEAQARFVQYGLFYAYAMLDTDHIDDHLHAAPAAIAARYAALAASGRGLEERMAGLREQPWRRRLHRDWAAQQLQRIADPAARRRLLAVHRLGGTARDYDEEKRRLNMKLWRSLVALADAWSISLKRVDLDGLLAAIEDRGGAITLDPLFTAGTTG
jgi:hypothetical protein